MGALETVMENGANDAEASELLTLMTMFEYVPAFVAAGVPASVPELVLNVAQAGLPEIENLSVYPDGPDAVGVKLYACPATSVVGGVPEITGAAIW